MSSHPPHCPSVFYVREVNGELEIKLPHHHDWRPYEPRFLASDCDWLPVVKALEEVAWRKDGDRLDQLVGEMCERNMLRHRQPGQTVGIENTTALRNAAEEASKNAMAWRVWDGE